MIRATVPETTIDENGQSEASPYYVSSNTQARLRPNIDSEPDSPCVESPPNQQFGLSVLPLLLAHS